MMPENPFEVLRLDPSVGEDEIVRQASRLRQRATDEATRNAIRQAVQALTARPEDRQLLALLTHPAPRHLWPALDRFAAVFRRAPDSHTAIAPCSPLDLDAFRDLVRMLAAEELALPALLFEPLPAADSPVEIGRQTAEALWQNLLVDPRA